MSDTDIHSMKISTLALYGLNADSHAMGYFENPDGSTGSFYAPAESCFRCMGVCPGYWSLESLVNYAFGNNLVRQGARIWYGMEHEKGTAQVKVYQSPGAGKGAATMNLRLIRIVRQSYKEMSLTDGRRRVNVTLASYQGDDGHEYRKSFESYDEPYVPESGTHETLNAKHIQW